MSSFTGYMYVQHKNDFLTKIGHYMDINPWYDQEKWPNLSKQFFELSVPCERAHCKVQKNGGIVEIGHSKLNLWIHVVKCEKPQVQLLVYSHNFS